MSNEQWGKVDKSQYIEQQKKILKDAYPAAMRNLLEKHRSGWFEVGHVRFNGTDRLYVNSVGASPLSLPDAAVVRLDIPTMDGVYTKFHRIIAPLIEDQVNSWMNSEAMHMCRDLPGCTPPTDQEAHQKIEDELRERRLVMVGSGDLLSQHLDKLMLVDYVTEEVLYEIAPASLDGMILWKYPATDQWRRPRMDPKAAQPSSAETKDFGQVAIGTDTDQQSLEFSGGDDDHLVVTTVLSGDTDKSFVVTNGCATDSYHVGSCGVGIAFRPTSEGEHAATLMVTENGSPTMYLLTASSFWPWDIYADMGKPADSKRNVPS
jgi:hypothetical protein